MNQLPRILETFGKLIADGSIKVDTVKSSDGGDVHRIQFSESQWPKNRPVAFTPVAFKTQAVAGEDREKTLLRAMLTVPESLHKLSKLVKTYQLRSSVTELFQDIRDVQTLHKDNLGRFDAFTQKGCHGVEIFFIRPECSSMHPKLFKGAMRPNQAMVEDLAISGMYRSVAVLAVPPEIAAADVAGYAYKALQEKDWRNNPDIIAMADIPRGASLGDVFIIHDRTILAASKSGFTKLERFWPSGAYDKDPKANYGLSSPSL